MNRLLLILVLITSGSTCAFAQDNYRSVASGLWSSAAVWEKDVNGNGIFTAAISAPTSIAGIVQVRSGHTVRVTSSVIIDQLTVETGGTLNIATSQSLSINNGTGDDLTINGILNDSGTLTISTVPTDALVRVNGTLNNLGLITNSSAARLFFENNSNYSHNFTTTAGIIPTANWHIGSNCIIAGYTTNTAVPAGLNQTFGNFIWNTTALNLNDAFYLVGEPSNIAGSFKVLSTGPTVNGSALCLNSSTSNKTVLITDSFIVDNDAVVILNSDIAATTNVSASYFKANGTNTTFVLAGDGNGNLFLSKSLDILNGSLSQGTISNNSAIVFKNANNTVRLFNSLINNDVLKFIVDTNTTLEIGATSFLSSTDSLIVRIGGGVKLMSNGATGAYSGGSAFGNVRTTRRLFLAGSKLIYGSPTAQFMGSGLPSGAEVVIRNIAGVTLNANTPIPTALNLDSGFINLNNFTLTLGTSSSNKGTLTRNLGYLKNGTFNRWFDASAVTLGTNAGFYPFAVDADTNRFAWVGGTPSTGGTISVKHNATVGSSTISPSYIDGGIAVDVRSNFNWQMATANSFAGTNLSVRILAGKNPGITSLSFLRVSLASSIAPGTSAAGTGLLTEPEANRDGLSASNLSNTFYFSSNSSQNPLPVKFLSVKATGRNNAMKIVWEVAQEKNVSHYLIQSSSNLSQWKTINQIKASNKSGKQQYSFELPETFTDQYLQVIAVDFTGSKIHSEILNLNAKSQNEGRVNIFPNPIPSNDPITITASEPILEVTLLNNIGATLITKAINGETTTSLPATFLPGRYYLKITTQSQTIIKPLLIK